MKIIVLMMRCTSVNSYLQNTKDILGNPYVCHTSRTLQYSTVRKHARWIKGAR